MGQSWDEMGCLWVNPGVSLGVDEHLGISPQSVVSPSCSCSIRVYLVTSAPTTARNSPGGRYHQAGGQLAYLCQAHHN